MCTNKVSPWFQTTAAAATATTAAAAAATRVQLDKSHRHKQVLQKHCSLYSPSFANLACFSSQAFSFALNSA